MLRQADREESKVKTVTLARATYNGSSPPGIIGITGHRNSIERERLPSTASPEVRRLASVELVMNWTHLLPCLVSLAQTDKFK